MPRIPNRRIDVFKHIDMSGGNENDCWEWKGRLNPKDGRPYFTCCSPHHLRWGTHQDNMNDMKERERHGLPKIVIRAICKLLSEGKTQSAIAELYGISRETVSSISTGRRSHDTPIKCNSHTILKAGNNLDKD